MESGFLLYDVELCSSPFLFRSGLRKRLCGFAEEEALDFGGSDAVRLVIADGALQIHHGLRRRIVEGADAVFDEIRPQIAEAPELLLQIGDRFAAVALGQRLEGLRLRIEVCAEVRRGV